MTMHFSKTLAGACLVCGRSFATATNPVNRDGSIRCGLEVTNDAGLWNSMPDRCAPRFHVTTIDGKMHVVGVRTEKHGIAPPDAPRAIG